MLYFLEYECEICKKKFSKRSYLQAHTNTHKNQFPCKRKDCSVICSTSYALKIHETDHEGSKPFLCVTCGIYHKLLERVYILRIAF